MADTMTTKQMMAMMDERKRRGVTRIIGDIHGKLDAYKKIAVGAERSVQIGDFGIGFGGPSWHSAAEDFQSTRMHRFIRGNHDDPERVRSMPGWIMDGKIENDVMYVGGAWSIDRAWRTPGLDWWPEEELSERELEDLIKRYELVQPEVMITHDGPTTAIKQMFMGGTHKKYYPNRTSEALERMWQIHRPRYWFFGHWHQTKKQAVEGTTFHCLGELAYVDFCFEEKAYVDDVVFT